jgi:DNA-binding response OmpR family regulator
MTKVLVIEDDSLVSRTLISHLKKRGFEVRGAENGEDGLALFREFQPDVGLLDV